MPDKISSTIVRINIVAVRDRAIDTGLSTRVWNVKVKVTRDNASHHPDRNENRAALCGQGFSEAGVKLQGRPSRRMQSA
jgi:hypothetical protein